MAEARSKIPTILKFSALAFVLLLIILWLFTGGIQKSINAGKILLNPVALYLGDTNATGTLFLLPWRPNDFPRGPEIDASAMNPEMLSEEEIENRLKVQNTYGASSGLSDPRTYGTPSPYYGQILLSQHGTQGGGPSSESLMLTANTYDAPVSLAGWSVQSAVTGKRAYLPLGISHFVLGSVNNAQPVVLESGISALLISGNSPIGGSFRENMCMGYLNERQSFTPPLTMGCPDISRAMPITADNIRIYGEGCIDYVQSMRGCDIPTDLPSELSASCRSFIAEAASYNGCTRANQQSAGFLLPTWRLYLSSGIELWQDLHDVVRLLDDKGRVVDVLTY